ncbi:uncharacterized protein At1g10890-like [Temnothorax curvispinosus]|uniref:Uncharacterized protein At1g10890-like n=1 Tax=Temnothorax curvispinosus TaxID=300111 RepID=A0A6J1RGN0_9HYME|nr:uncharacterized protein At1g10890-like [Temnothorax curvispinosus]
MVVGDRVEKEKWGGKGSNWEKVKELFAEGLKVRVTVREVIVVGQRGIWLTILVKLRDEEEKWQVLEARSRAGNRVGVKIHEDKSVERRDREKEERKEKIEERLRRSTERSEDEEISKEMEDKLLVEDESEEEKEEGGKRAK